MSALNVKLPDGTALELEGGRDRRRRGRGDRARAGPGGARRRGSTVSSAISPPRSPTDAELEIVTDRSEGALDLIRHDAAHVLATAVCELWPGHEGLDRPADRGRLLLRLRVPRGGRASPRPTSRRSRRRCAEHIAADERFERDEMSRSPRRSSASGDEDEPYKVELIEDLVRDEGVETVSLYRNGPFTDLCRGPHAPSTGPDQRRQAELGRRRLLARRRDPPDADPDLRHRLLHARRTSRRTSSGSRQARARDHRRLGPELELFMLLPEAPGMPFWLPHGTVLLQPDPRARSTRSCASAATTRSRPRRSSTRSSGTAPATTRTTARTCSSPSRPSGTAGPAPLRGEADELPRRLSGLRLRAPLLPRAAAAAGRVRQRLAATSARACCTGCCACAPSPRTTPTSSARPEQIEDEVIDICEAIDELYATLRLRRRQGRALDPAGEGDRHRRAVGAGGGGAGGGARRARAASIS